MSEHGMTGLRRAAVALGVAAVMLALASPAARAQMPAKLKKQIEVMEKIFDEVLVDSPNLLVGSHQPTNGIYLEDYGVVFAVEASLLPHDRRMGGLFDWNKFKMRKEDGKWVMEFGEDDDEDKDSDSEQAKNDDEPEIKSDEQLYEGAKGELTTALLDYGDTLTGLNDNQWVALVVFLGGDDFFRERETDTLVLRAKVTDLRAYGGERLSQKDMESRLVVEEY